MPKVSIQTIENLQNESSAIGKLNSNFTAIQTIIETLLSRDGRAPNQMLSVLDMNTRRIINLPAPISPTEPARHGDIQQYVDRAEAAAEDAEESAENAEQSATEAAESATEAENLLNDFRDHYMGSFPDDPTEAIDGSPLEEGALYYNSVIDQLRYYILADVFVDAEPVMVDGEIVQMAGWVKVPISTLLGLSDVDAEGVAQGQILLYDGTSFVNQTPEAELIVYDNDVSLLTADTVQEALDEIVDRSLLGRYDFSVFIKGLLVENDTVFRLLPVRAFTVPSVTTLFHASSVTGSTGTQVLTLRKNGVQFGTVTFTSSSTGVWSIPGNTSFSASDVFTITTGGTVDSAIKDISLTFAATR